MQTPSRQLFDEFVRQRRERIFAHARDRGGMGRSWLRGVTTVEQRYSIVAAAHNLGRMLRKPLGIGKPKKSLQAEGGLVALLLHLLRTTIAAWPAPLGSRELDWEARLAFVGA